MSVADPEALFRQISELIATMPDLLERHGTNVLDSRIPDETHRWLGKLYSIVDQIGGLTEATALGMAIDRLSSAAADRGADQIRTIAYRALALAEAKAPAAVQGSFIPSGHGFDAFSALGKIFASATRDILLVDPYLDATVVTDFVVLAPEGIPVRLLADEASVKASLKPAIERWIEQHDTARPLEAKLATPRALHDRVIVIDQANVYILTQSFKDFANRAPGSIAKVDADTAKLKVSAYDALFADARNI
jgi:hypothetical protein